MKKTTRGILFLAWGMGRWGDGEMGRWGDGEAGGQMTNDK